MRKKGETKIIGVMGTDSKVGVTHLAIMISNYIANVYGKKVGYLEYDGESSVKWLCENEKKFKHYGINFYTSVYVEKLPELIAKGYDYIVIDFSSDYFKGRSEFLRCNKKIVVGDVNPWNIINYYKFIERTSGECNCDKWIYTATFGILKDKMTLGMDKRILVYKIPYNPDIFKIKHNNLELMEKLLC